ncbi:GntR family transcriptional regulator [Myxococcota bacterium]|nr:GntR family transcriptional regulator [Myxococcota bacterium]MBU1382656.1 GntR family transcriptional regulator [Myxococcota bacterium]MBU1497252.1 GntR family transcriptional regulator [Myxococcota bacterium]
MERYPVIDPLLQKPVFLQIEHQIQEFIISGDLGPAAKLPSERQMAEQLGVSRGTVKKAYENLVRTGFLEVRRGSGCFVRGQSKSSTRLETAQKLIRTVIFELEKIRFSHREMGDLFSSEVTTRVENLQNFSVVTIDCNPEALDVYHIQLASLSHVNHLQMLLTDLESENDPRTILKNYDLIITTMGHYERVSSLAGSLKDRVISVGVSPSAETLVQLGAIRSSMRIGIISRSHRFQEIVTGWIRKFHPNNSISGINVTSGEQVIDLIDKADVLIVPSSGSGTLSTEQLNSIRSFRQRGGVIIKFEYRIEAGSLGFLEKLFFSLTI